MADDFPGDGAPLAQGPIWVSGVVAHFLQPPQRPGQPEFDPMVELAVEIYPACNSDQFEWWSEELRRAEVKVAGVEEVADRSQQLLAPCLA